MLGREARVTSSAFLIPLSQTTKTPASSSGLCPRFLSRSSDRFKRISPLVRVPVLSLHSRSTLPMLWITASCLTTIRKAPG